MLASTIEIIPRTMLSLTLCCLVTISVVFAKGPCHDAHVEFLAGQALGLVGAYEPRCLEDGTFGNVQCKGSGCECVLRNGDSIPDTFINFGTPGTATRDCNCARTVAEANVGPHGRPGFEPRCDDKGNYARVQCTGSKCYCADNMGKPMSDDLMVNRWEEQSLTCP